MEKLTDSNLQLVAAKYYDNPGCVDIIEFYDDLNRIKYLKRLFKRYSETGDLKERLILNHLIILYNVFDHQVLTSILLFKLPEYWPLLKPFLMYLNYWPSTFTCPKTEVVVRSDDVAIDDGICQALRKI